MRVRLLLLFLIISLLMPIKTFGESNDKWSYLDQVSDQALQMTKQKEYEKAKKLLEHFSYEFRNDQDDKILSMSQLRVLTVSYEEALHAVTAIDSGDDERLQKVMQFRLVVDAIHSIYQPLWTEMEQTVMASFHDMKASLLEEENMGDSHHINEFLSMFNVIYPSLVIDLDQEQITKIESHISFLEQYRSVSSSEQINHLNVMENDLNSLFQTLHMDETDPSFLLVIATVAGSIFFTLFYVGWKKYKGIEA